MWGRLARIGGVVVCVLVLLTPTYDGQAPLAVPPEPANPDGGRILDYSITVDVDDEGRFDIDHAIRILVPEGFRGVSFTQTRSPEGAGFRFLLDDFHARLDGEDVEDAVWLDPELRVQRVSVFSDEGLSEGEHLFEFGFTLANGVGPPLETAFMPHEGIPNSELLSFPTGGWALPMDTLTMRYRLPGNAVVARCTLGSLACEDTGVGTREVTFTATELEPFARPHVVIGMASPDPGRRRTLWAPVADPVLGQSLEPAGRLLVLSAIAVMAGVFLGARVRQRQQVRPVYEPPNGIGPAQAALLLGDVPAERATQATLRYLVQRGVLEGTDGVRDVGTPEEWARIDPVSRSFAESLLAGTPSSLLEDAAARNVEQGHLVPDRIALVCRYVLVPLALGAALVLMLLNPQRMSLWGLPFALFVVFAGDVLLPGALTRRSESGRILWSRTAGFRKVLSGDMPVGLDREPELYDEWLPWAIAFGCEQEWHRRRGDELAKNP